MLICTPATHLRDALYGKRDGVSILLTSLVTSSLPSYRLQVTPRYFITVAPPFMMLACRHGTGHGIGHFLNVHEGKMCSLSETVGC
jgi:hypothetical protein